MRILSLLPSATEIVYALGSEDDLVGVTHECDWPPSARAKRSVSYSALPPAADPAEVDRLVSESIDGGEPIYRLDNEAVRELRPDLVLTQDLCAVCAVPSGHVNDALELLGCRAEVVSMDPSSLDDVLECILHVGDCDRDRGRRGGPRRRDCATGSKSSPTVWPTRARPRTFALEWSDPPFNGGHWVPEMVELAGGEAVLASRGTPSVRVTWEQIVSAAPEVVVFMPCGYDLEGAVAEALLAPRP